MGKGVCPTIDRLQLHDGSTDVRRHPSYLTFKPYLEQSDMTHTAGIAHVIRQLYPQLDAGQPEPMAHTQGPTLATTGPGAGKIPSIAHRCGNIPTAAQAKPLKLAPSALPKTIRRLRRLEIRVGR